MSNDNFQKRASAKQQPSKDLSSFAADTPYNGFLATNLLLARMFSRADRADDWITPLHISHHSSMSSAREAGVRMPGKTVVGRFLTNRKCWAMKM